MGRKQSDAKIDNVESYVDEILTEYIAVVREAVQTKAGAVLTDDAALHLREFYGPGFRQRFSQDQTQLNDDGKDYMRRRATQIADQAVFIAKATGRKEVDRTVVDAAAIRVQSQIAAMKTRFQSRRPGVPLGEYCPSNVGD
jgi:hypothetical protein